MFSAEAWNEALDAVSRELLDRAGIEDPPVDALEVARRLDVAVAIDAGQFERGRHKRLSGRASIFLRPEERPERLQWAAAHELGEGIAYRVFEHLNAPDDDVSPRMREEVANHLAGRLLLPGPGFLEEARCLNANVLRLKHRYRTASHELIAYRLLDLPIPTVVTVFDHGRPTRRRSNIGGRLPPLQPVERECRQEAHRTNRSVERHTDSLFVQAWPVHQAGWKREILRTTAETETE